MSELRRHRSGQGHDYASAIDALSTSAPLWSGGSILVGFMPENETMVGEQRYAVDVAEDLIAVAPVEAARFQIRTVYRDFFAPFFKSRRMAPTSARRCSLVRDCQRASTSVLWLEPEPFSFVR